MKYLAWGWWHTIADVVCSGWYWYPVSRRIEAQFQALRYFTLAGTDHRTHEELNSMIRRYIRWRNRNARDETPREVTKRVIGA